MFIDYIRIITLTDIDFVVLRQLIYHLMFEMLSLIHVSFQNEFVFMLVEEAILWSIVFL
jgi:hypothetical protein